MPASSSDAGEDVNSGSRVDFILNSAGVVSQGNAEQTVYKSELAKIWSLDFLVDLHPSSSRVLEAGISSSRNTRDRKEKTGVTVSLLQLTQPLFDGHRSGSFAKGLPTV